MTFEDVTILFYFMTFIPESHILAPKGDFLTFFTHFGHFGGLPDQKEKNKKWHMTQENVKKNIFYDFYS